MKKMKISSRITASVYTIAILFGLLLVLLPTDSVSANYVNDRSVALCNLAPKKAGDVLVRFNGFLRADNPNHYHVISHTNIPAGKYKVTMITWDDHDHKPGQVQPNEQVVLELKDSNDTRVAVTGATKDIPDHLQVMTSVISNNLNVSRNVTMVAAIHMLARTSNPNSVVPACALFEKIVETPPQDMVLTCNVNKTNVAIGESVTYTATATGGTSPYTYAWNGSVTGSGSTKSTSFSTAGNKSATVTATDNSGTTRTANCPVVVVQNVTPPGFSATCTVNKTSVNIGESVTYTANATGGTGGYNYSWSGVVTGSGSTKSTSFNTTGSKNASVTVTDSSGTTKTANCPVVVVGQVTSDFSIICEVNSTSVRTGERVTYSVDINGGRSPYEYRWRGDIEGENSNASRIRVRYDDSGRYNVRVTVTDRDGNRASDDCPSVRVRDGGTTITETPTGTLASLDSVFLSQVPYTGAAEDAAKVLGFMSILILWSIAITVVFYSRHKKNLRSIQIAQFKENNKAL